MAGKTEISKIKKYYSNIGQKIEQALNVLNSNKYVMYIEDLKQNKDYFVAISPQTAQQKGPRHQNRIIDLFKWTKTPSTLNKGDAVSKNREFYEIKCSTPSLDGNVLNLVQIRVFQDIQYYLCVFVDDVNYKENYVFLLTHKQMAHECEICGASAHMIKSSAVQNKNREFRISINLDDKTNPKTKRWLKEYRNVELEKIIFNGSIK